MLNLSSWKLEPPNTLKAGQALKSEKINLYSFFLRLAERYKNSKPKWWGQINREELPRSRVKLTEEQVEEIDRQKAASRAD